NKKVATEKSRIAHSAFASYSLIDVDSSEEYVYSSNKSSDDNFIKFDNSDEMNLIIKQLHSALTVSFKKKECPTTYIRNFKCIWQRKNKVFRKVVIGSKKSSKEPSKELGKELDEELGEESGDKSDKEIDEKKIYSAIEFVDGIFAFDNITSHKVLSEDALMASKMNLGLDGSALKMWDMT
ncbi:4305_t:CDS:2, partial [Cetraspora pellucida]